MLCLVYYLSFSLLPPQNPKITSMNNMSPIFRNRIFCLICTESCYDNPLAMIKFTLFQHLTRWILSLQNFTQNSVLNANGLHCHVLAKVFLIYNHFQMVDINSTNLKLFFKYDNLWTQNLGRKLPILLIENILVWLVYFSAH